MLCSINDTLCYYGLGITCNMITEVVKYTAKYRSDLPNKISQLHVEVLQLQHFQGNILLDLNTFWLHKKTVMDHYMKPWGIMSLVSVEVFNLTKVSENVQKSNNSKQSCD